MQPLRVQGHGAKLVGTFMLLFVELHGETLLSLQGYHKNDKFSKFIILSVSGLYTSIIREDIHHK